ncbi:MAG: ABC transporter permease [Candidatus Sulfopaludibacter sp.]|nr:ABC transporter permease [Candidatus Sulfopaludibacter sp.]
MRLAFRSLWRKPAFALVAVATIALGVGANTALFGVIYTVLIQPLPFRDPGKLVQIWETHPALPQLQVTVPDFQDWRTQARSFEQLAAYTLSAMNTGTLLGQGEPEIVHATMAGSNLFPMMGIRPLAGRAFTDAEERAKQNVALISESLWRRKFGADPAVVGRQIRLDAQSFAVLGIVPRRQAFPEWADLWIPLSLIEPGLATRRKFHPLEVIARLGPGVRPEQAQAEMQAIARRLEQAHPDTNRTIGAFVIPLARQTTGAVRPSLLLAWAAVGLILLMACANLAHLFLARVIERRQEMSIRVALGARPWQLMGQVAREALLVAAVGGAAGMISAIWTSQLLSKLAASQIGRAEWTGFAAPVWLFAAAISLTGGLLFALPACWQVMRARMTLGDAGRSVTRGRSRISAALMAGQVAMALLVLAGVALLTRSFAALLREDPGFRAAGVWTVPNLPLGTAQWRSALLRTPGVADAALVNSAPMSLLATERSRFATRFGLEGRSFDPGSYPVAQNRWASPEFFSVLAIPLKSGRRLTEADRNQPRILVNETLARRFFPHRDAVGKRLILGVMDPRQTAVEIVGVAGDVRDLGLDQEVEPTMYGIGATPVMTLLVKMAGPGAYATELRDAIHGIDPSLPITSIQPLEQNVSESLARRRFALVLLALFAGMAAFLIAAGIYALLAQSVNARLREFGVRAAIGAAPGELVRMILREAFRLMVPGMAAGVALLLAFAKLMKSFVYQLSPTDPVSIAGAAAFLFVLTFLSAWLPARRAASVDPATALSVL